MKKPKSISADEFTYATVFTWPLLNMPLVIVAKSMDDLERAWDTVNKGCSTLNKRKVKRIKITAPKEDEQ